MLVSSEREGDWLMDDTTGSQNAKDLLRSLRWDVDMVITNYDGERVWLGPSFDAKGQRNGITDCCPEAKPCDHHANVARRTGN